MATGVLHVYHPSRGLTLFEHTPFTLQPAQTAPSSTSIPAPRHVLLFVGGMFDNFGAPQYVRDLAHLFPIHPQQLWRVMHVQLSSNGRAFGIMTLDRDVEEMGLCVSFIRDNICKNPDASIVLMGHSTGCQDIMRYLTAPNPISERQTRRPKVQGAILQASVSDRDAVIASVRDGPNVKTAYEAAMKIVKETPESAHRHVVLPMNITTPLFGPVPLNITRFLSLVSPDSPANPSDEDFFSADLTDARLRSTFGFIGKNGLLARTNDPTASQQVLVLMSDSDEFVRPHVKQRNLLDRWKQFAREDTGAAIHGDSAVILNALHDVRGNDWPSQEARLVILRRKVLAYLRDVAGGVDEHADQIWHKDGDRVAAIKIGDGRIAEQMTEVLKL